MDVEQIQLNHILVPHTHFILAGNLLAQCYQHAANAKDPACLAIIGDSGTGKSTVLEEFESKYPRYRTETGLMVPILRLRLPSKPSVNHLLEQMLQKLGDPLYDKGTENLKLLRLIKQFGNTQTVMLMLDEFQHFVDRRTERVLHHLADTLKVIVDESRLVLVVAGLPRCMAVIHQNEQLARRFLAPVQMPRFDWSKPADRAQFVGILKTIQKALINYELPDLEDADMAFRFYCATGGLVGYVIKILKQSLWDASDRGTTRINLSDLQHAYHQAVWSQPHKGGLSNPFDCNIVFSPDEKTLASVREIGVPDEC